MLGREEPSTQLLRVSKNKMGGLKKVAGDRKE